MKYIALLRGINVGKIRIKMIDLKQMFEDIGFENVKTYIQSGNVAFESAEMKREELIQIIEESIEATFEYKIKTIVLTAKELEVSIKTSPFKEEGDWKLYFGFLTDELTKEQEQLLRESSNQNEKYDIDSRLVWALLNKTSHDKMLYDSFEKVFKVSMTVRNLNTVNKLLELSSEE